MLEFLDQLINEFPKLTPCYSQLCPLPCGQLDSSVEGLVHAHLFDQNLTQIHVTIPSLQKIWEDSENISTTRKAQMKDIKNPKKNAIFGLLDIAGFKKTWFKQEVEKMKDLVKLMVMAADNWILNNFW